MKLWHSSATSVTGGVKLETAKESGKREADLLEHTDEDLTVKKSARCVLARPFFLCFFRMSL